MWTFTRIGFYSATRSRTEPDKMQIRGRVRADLENLQRFAQENGITQDPGLANIIHTPQADYHHRLIVRPETWTALITALAVDIDYPNFKDTITDPERHAAYSRVWSIMYGVQEDETWRTFGTRFQAQADPDPDDYDPDFEEDVQTMTVGALMSQYGCSRETAMDWKRERGLLL